MALHLKEIGRAVAPGAHAVVLLDQAGWHTTAKLDIPENISLMPFAHQVTGTQSGRKRLAILAPELALQPRLRQLRSHP